MSIGSLGGIAASAAGSPLAQTKGSEVERAEQDGSAVERKSLSDQKAESAAGIGETDGQDHEAAERDADGRRLWERRRGTEETEATDESAAPLPPQSKDVTGQSGSLLDLSG